MKNFDHILRVGNKEMLYGDPIRDSHSNQDINRREYMSKSKNIIAAKRMAIAVAAVCASLTAPAFATTDNKALLDLMLKKGVITQKDYDEFVDATRDAEENKAFKEKRVDQDLAKASAFLQKNADAGQVMKNGIGIQSADGANSIQLTGRIHMDYRNYGASVVSGSESPLQDKFEVRRARLGVKGQFQKDWKYEIVGNFGMSNNGMSSSATEIDVAYFDYAANPAASVRLGKFKMPFSLEQLTSSNNIDFMERSLVGQSDSELIPGKETGLMLFGSPVSGATYAVALSTGRGNKDAQNDKPDLIARGTINANKLFAGDDSIVTHLGFAYSTGDTKGMTPASARTETRESSEFFRAATALTGTVTRERMGLEAAIAYNALKVQGEYFDFKYQGDNRTDKIKGYYAQVVYNLTGEKHNYSNSSGTFGWIKPNQPFSLDKGGLGAWQVGLRLSNFDAADVAVASGKTNKADSASVGLTWFMNDYARVMLNYITTDFDGQAVGAAGKQITKDRAIMLRAQLSF